MEMGHLFSMLQFLPFFTLTKTIRVILNCFSHLAKVLEVGTKEGSTKAAKPPFGELELVQYLQVTTLLSTEFDPLEYWTKQMKTYPLLSSPAFDIILLSIPALSTLNDFFTADESTLGKRNWLTDKNL